MTERTEEHAAPGTPDEAADAGAAPEDAHRVPWEGPLRAPRDVWAVFLQARKRDPHVYVGDVHAPDAEMALVLAKENYTRRDPCVNLWVVRADQIHATTAEAAEMFEPVTDKSYRFGGSYRQQQKAYRTSWRLPQREEDQE